MGMPANRSIRFVASLNACLRLPALWLRSARQCALQLIFWNLACLLLSPTASAQEKLSLTHADTTVADYHDWYQVEIIIFANKNPAGNNEIPPFKQRYYPASMYSVAAPAEANWTPENAEQQAQIDAYLALFETVDQQPAPDSEPNFLFESRSRFADRAAFDAGNSPPKNSAERRTLDGFDTKVVSAALNTNRSRAYAALEPSQHELSKIARSLERSSRYRLLTHQAWRQPFTEESLAEPILIQTGMHAGDDYEVDGTLLFYRSRFLHVKADLWYTPITAEEASSQNALAPNKRRPTTNDFLANDMSKDIQPAFATRLSYQLEHARRMRSATLHYIDHPLFGILIKIEDYAGPPAR